ncbi:shikimate kinase [Acidipropionibacterium virtanenii]|uniref:Shikimate kinase n=1 Tax=Acidipropionibacterium virtanenii TaxID=2057246 RepID=A0A344UU51_9ACTN|nr:shikimate kinase [Acidipropionibacterium virtanenii]AXE38799.1 Shikimate kinase [Acidipropionibacterium virtanenii]
MSETELSDAVTSGTGAPSVVAVIGAPGSGKSTVGPLLAARLGRRFVDVDTVIEEAEGRPISDIFVTDGEPCFRELETRHTLAELAAGGVVSLGGGAPATPVVGEALTRVCVVWLEVSARTASGRVGLNDATRPLLMGNVHSRMVRLMAERRPVYAAPADIHIVTDRLRPDQIVEEICTRLAELSGPSPAV